MENKEVGIKETSELLKAIEVLGVLAIKVGKDGVDATDALTIVSELGANYRTLIDGFTGLSELKAELSNLEREEVIELIGRIYEIVAAGEAAAK